MPPTYEELQERLSRQPLPTSLPIADIVTVMEALGYTVAVTGSHYHFRKPGARRITMAVHRKRVTRPAVKEIAALLRQGHEPDQSTHSRVDGALPMTSSSSYLPLPAALAAK